MRDQSKQNPKIKPSLRNPPRKRNYFTRSPQAFFIEKYNISRSGYHSKFHQTLHLILVTYKMLFTMCGTTHSVLQHHRILRLPRKITLIIHSHHICNIIYNARNNTCRPPISPNIVPATHINFYNFPQKFLFTIRDRSEQGPSIKPLLRKPPRKQLSFQISHNATPATKSDTETSPKIVPAIQSDT